MQGQGHFLTCLNYRQVWLCLNAAGPTGQSSLFNSALLLVGFDHLINKHNLSSSLVPGLRCAWCQALWQQKHRDLKLAISIKQL